MSCSTVQERYTPRPLGANSTYVIPTVSVGGFLAVAGGTLNLYRKNEVTGNSDVVVANLPVLSGVYYPIPFYLGQNGGSIVLSDGAAGTLAI